LKTLLSDIASVHSGIYAKPGIQGEVYYLQSKNFNADREFDFSTKPELYSDGKIQKHFLQHGDILLVAKGNYNFAINYRGLYPAVASSIFIIIRIRDKERITPEYLTWFLNLHSTQGILGNLSRGSAMPSLTKSQVEQLSIMIPPREKQEIVVKINGLKKLERSINRQLQELKEQEIENLLLTAIK
jgi:restriction endonuclease S subunit